MSVTVSPDGGTLVVDLLGRLWSLPAQGGAATPITDELLEARWPSFSPAGGEIAFQGYGVDWDIWSVGPDGSVPKRLTWGPFDDQEPHWSHDGSRVAFSSDRSRNYDIWLLDTRTGRLRQLTTDSAQDAEPSWSPDDREIAFVSTREPSGVWAVNVETAAVRLIAEVEGGGRSGGPHAPVWATDGKRVLYNVIANGASRLELSGNQVVEGEDVFPFRASWLSDTEFLYTADGMIKKRVLGTEQAQVIEFTATIPVKQVAYERKQRDLDSREPRPAHGIVRPVVSPDGKRVAFGALGDLWVMEIGSKPTRITSDRFLDADPAWSPDGSQLIFSTDRAENGNLDLWVRDLDTNRERRLTDSPTADIGGTWSPEGRRVAFLNILPHQAGAAVNVLDVASGVQKELWRSDRRIPSNPTWSPDGRTLMIGAFDQYSRRSREGIWKLMLLPIDGGQARFLESVVPHTSIVNGIDEGPVWSPDGSSVLVVNEGVLKVLEVDINGEPLGSLRQLSDEAAYSPSWTSDSRNILYLATDQLKMLSLGDGEVRNIPLGLTWVPSTSQGRLVVRAGRLWNGLDETLRENVDIVIEGSRIVSIEPQSGSLTGDVVDASDLTVIPGLVDMHAHVYREYGEALGRLMLAYGITSARDPVGMGYRALELREASEAGVRVGPRLYESASAFDGTRGAFAEMYWIDSWPRLELELERSRRLDYDLFKNYVRLPRALQKRVVEYAHEIGVPVTSHEVYPAATWGQDGTEHLGGRTSALGNVYDDQIKLLGSGMTWCPTMVVSGYFNLLAAEDPSLLKDERLEALCPHWAMEPTLEGVARLRKGGTEALSQRLAHQGRALLTLFESGVRVVAGTDAPNMPHGPGIHAELELYVRSGLSPVDALKTATIEAARELAVDEDVGSLEPGKIADMVIIDGDPLSDIRNTRNVRTVIRSGEVFDVDDLVSGELGSGSSDSNSDR